MWITINGEFIKRIVENIDNSVVYNMLKNNVVTLNKVKSTDNLLVYNADNEIVEVKYIDNSIKYVKCTCTKSHKNHRVYPSANIKCEHELSVILYIDDYLKKCDDSTSIITHTDGNQYYGCFYNNIDYDIPLVFDYLTRFKEYRYIYDVSKNNTSSFDKFLSEYIEYIKLSNLEKFLGCNYDFFPPLSTYSVYKNIGNENINEDYIMNNFDEINIDLYKKIKPELFEKESISIAFKLFLMMKGKL